MQENKNVNAPVEANEEEQLIEQARIRREKLAKLVAEGKNPYEMVKYPVDADSESIKANFEAYEGKTVCMAGRMMSRRIMGKASFSHISDKSGNIQIYVTRQDIGEENYASYKKDYDIGDIIGVKGVVFKTQTGEISLHVQEMIMLTKSLLPLPEKYNGLQNQDLKYRLRHLDLIMNDDVKKTFRVRSQILKEIRAYLDGMGYLEVDTPTLLTLEIGADARPFKTHHNALDLDMYMRIETELFLKRLIVGGLDKVYEVGRIFRNEGMDAFHNPEFTTIEMYQAYSDYVDMMNLIEDLYKTVTLKVCGTLDITYQGTVIHMGEWTRLTMAEAVKKYAGVDYNDWATDEDGENKVVFDDQFVVNEDGILFTKDDMTEIDRFKVVRFDNERYLKKMGNSLYSTNDIAGPAYIAEGNERPTFMQGYTETSNVNVVNEMVQMIEVNRAYEANQKTITSEDSMMGTLWQKVAVLQ